MLVKQSKNEQISIKNTAPSITFLVVCGIVLLIVSVQSFGYVTTSTGYAVALAIGNRVLTGMNKDTRCSCQILDPAVNPCAVWEQSRTESTLGHVARP